MASCEEVDPACKPPFHAPKVPRVRAPHATGSKLAWALISGACRLPGGRLRCQVSCSRRAWATSSGGKAAPTGLQTPWIRSAWWRDAMHFAQLRPPYARWPPPPLPPPAAACRSRRFLLLVLPTHQATLEAGTHSAAAMAFWGCEVKPGKATPFVPPPEASKLHLSQARTAGGDGGPRACPFVIVAVAAAWGSCC